MKKILTTSILATSILLGATSDYKYEITPMIGSTETEGNMNIDDQFNYGVSIGRNLDNSIFNQLELGILRTTATKYYNTGEKTTLHKLFVNGVKEYELNNKFSLYALAGAGYETFSNKQTFNDNENNIFVNYGVGIKYKINEMLSLKADARHLVDLDSDNTLLYTVGVAIAFGKKIVNMPSMEKMPIEEPKPIQQPIIEKKPVDLDDDKDGVLNSKDNCPNSLIDDIVDENGCTKIVDLNINFEVNGAGINTSYSNKINEFAEFLKVNPKYKAIIEAHTDSDGSESYNLSLSQKRANATKKELISLGIEPQRIQAIGYGESKPLVPNTTLKNKSMNRRVTAILKK